MTRDEVIAMLKRDQGDKSLRMFAVELGISAPYLSDIYAGKRDPGPAVLNRYRLRRHEITEIRYVADAKKAS